MTLTWRSLFLVSLFPLALSYSHHKANAQIIRDRTLGSESSIINPINSQVDLIEGGARRGTNLFHSFLKFNIREGHAAYFANPAAIQSIFSRVTGINPSRLFGTLGNINITTEVTFGLAVQDKLTPLSDITASSEFGVSGNITINTAGINPTRGL